MDLPKLLDIYINKADKSKLKLTQEMGISYYQFYQYHKGQVKPKQDILNKIFTALSVPQCVVFDNKSHYLHEQIKNALNELYIEVFSAGECDKMVYKFFNLDEGFIYVNCNHEKPFKPPINANVINLNKELEIISLAGELCEPKRIKNVFKQHLCKETLSCLN